VSGAFTTGFGRYALGPGRLLVQLVEQSVSRLLGRELDVVFGSARAHMVMRAMHLEPTPLGMVTGRMDTVDVALDEVRWEHGRLDHLRLHARGVHVTPGLRPALVASPVHVEAHLRQDTLDHWLDVTGVEWRIRLAGDGYVEVRWPGRETWGHAVFRPDVRDNVLHLAPEEVVVRGRRVPEVVHRRYVKPVAYDIPPLPGLTRVSSVHPRPDHLLVRGVVDEIREPITPAQIDRMRRVIRTLAEEATELVLPRAR
jgi:hypothetical protein